jgi:hypothetical protein
MKKTGGAYTNKELEYMKTLTFSMRMLLSMTDALLEIQMVDILSRTIANAPVVGSEHVQ